ncbi:hypothetical protein V1478_008094, partial [Vespula squamosa]
SHYIEVDAYKDSQVKDDFILLYYYYYLKIKAISRQNLNSEMILTIQFRKLQSPLVRDSASYVRAQDSILPQLGIFKQMS